MSDISDVQRALVQIIFDTVYPGVNFDVKNTQWDSKQTWDGLASQSITGTPIGVYSGWPPPTVGLANVLGANGTHVTVFPKAGERNTTRYQERGNVTVAPVTTLVMNVFGNTVQIGGTVSTPQNLMMKVNGKQYVYAVRPNDTTLTIGNALAAMIAMDVPGTYAPGGSISVGPGGRIQATRVGGFGTVSREIRRQERIVQISIWTGTPALRDIIAAAVDVKLAGTHFFTLPDGFAARLIYKNSMTIDTFQKETLYRRDLDYSVEYATTTSEQAAQVIAPKIDIKSDHSSAEFKLYI